MKKLIIALFALVGVTLVSAPNQAYALDTPMITSARYIGSGQVHLNWSVVGDADFQVYYGPTNNPMQYAVTLGKGTDYTVGQLFKNTTYLFTVKAVRNGEVSAESNHVRVYVGTTGRVSAPVKTTPPTVKAKVGQRVEGKVVTPAVSYKPEADTMKVGGAYNDPYISSGKPGVGLFNLRTSRGPKSGQITLHWNEPSVNFIDKYIIYYSDDLANPHKWAVTSPKEYRNFTVGYLKPGVRYYFWMQAQTRDGVTEMTPWVSDLAR